MPGSRTSVGSVTSRWPLTRSEGISIGRPSRTGGRPVAKTTAPGADLAGRRPDRGNPVAADGDRRRGDPGGDGGQPLGQPGDGPQRIHPGLAPDQRAFHRPGQTGDQLGHLTGVQPLDRGGLVRREPALVGRQSEPVQLHQAQAAGQRAFQVPPPLQARPLQVDERLGVAPLMRFRDEQAGRAARSPRAQPAGLDEQDRTKSGRDARGRGAHAEDAAADDQHIRP